MSKDGSRFEEQLRKKMESYAEDPPIELWTALSQEVNAAAPQRFPSGVRIFALLLFFGFMTLALSLVFFDGLREKQPLPAAAPKADTLPVAFDERGRTLFRRFCTTCHDQNLVSDLTAPALFNITERRDPEWLIRFTRNSQQLIREGDPTALAVWDKWKPAVMPDFPMPEEDVSAIYAYIAQKSGQLRNRRNRNHGKYPRQ